MVKLREKKVTEVKKIADGKKEMVGVNVEKRLRNGEN